MLGTYLFLELEGDASDGSLFDSLHEMGGETYSGYNYISVPYVHHPWCSLPSLPLLLPRMRQRDWKAWQVSPGHKNGHIEIVIHYSPAILFLILLDWMTAISSMILLLVWKSLVSLLTSYPLFLLLLTFRSTSQ